jgi:hypothetical protein
MLCRWITGGRFAKFVMQRRGRAVARERSGAGHFAFFRCPRPWRKPLLISVLTKAASTGRPSTGNFNAAVVKFLQDNLK